MSWASTRVSLARHALRSSDTDTSLGTATGVAPHFVTPLTTLALLLELSHSVYFMLPIRHVPLVLHDIMYLYSTPITTPLLSLTSITDMTCLCGGLCTTRMSVAAFFLCRTHVVSVHSTHARTLFLDEVLWKVKCTREEW